MRASLQKNLQLLNAVYQGASNIALVKNLIERGANVNSTDFGLSPLTLAVEMDDCAMVTFLLENGADLDLPDGEGITPVEAAITNNCEAVLELLGERV